GCMCGLVRNNVTVRIEILDHVPEPKQSQKLVARIREPDRPVREFIIEHRIADTLRERDEELLRRGLPVPVNLHEHLAKIVSKQRCVLYPVDAGSKIQIC